MTVYKFLTYMNPQDYQEFQNIDYILTVSMKENKQCTSDTPFKSDH